MASSDTRKESSRGEVKVATTKYYQKPNGSAVINIPQGFDMDWKMAKNLLLNGTAPG